MRLAQLLPPNPERYTFSQYIGKNSVYTLMARITSHAFLLAGGIAVIYIIVGAYYYLTAYGNEEQANKGKKTITWAIVGLVVIILARVIFAEIWRFVTDTDLPSLP